ncbi:hypothetical protein [Burkholderia sp. Bp8998]|uniref:hypothetical protein n=1 Tax=Burkholderia sp. Bp8998 TaxID=2184557 RepID=UPI000F5AAD3F|nr:hypothetical protein [Burkholderia sp. Bp8998]RQS09153.1 hypothetical protein DIE06_32015 [Burkholderia sp. Bp8998]
MRKIIFVIVALSAFQSINAYAQLSGQVLPDRTSFEDVFAATNKFYPGQRLHIVVEGQIDANHRYWQDRECSWFGLSCHYVDRESSNLMGVSRLPLLMSLEPVEVLSAPAQIYQAQWYANSGARHLPVAADGIYDFVIKIPNADTSIDAFSSATVLRAVVADRYDGDTPIDRGQCHNRPPQCSSGSYKVTVDVHNDERLRLLTELLKKKRSTGEILSRDVMDPLFVQDGHVKADIANVLFEHANAFYKGETNDVRRDYLTIVSFASGLDPTRGDMLNEIAATYIALGEFTAATADVKKALDVSKANYDKEPSPREPDTVITLAKTLGLKASIWVQERGAMVGTDLMVAVGLYREAADYCNKEAATARSAADKARLYNCAKDHLIDAGRTLAMLRTRENLILADQLLTEAQIAARNSVDSN